MTDNEHGGCGCGHKHGDSHKGCGCGHKHGDAHEGCNHGAVTEATDNQKNFLHELGHRHYLPVARFTVVDSRDEGFVSTALAPVFIRSAADDMATVKEAGAFLQQLAQLGLITLDYDMPLGSYGYEEYKGSALYEYFCSTVAAAAARPGFMGDTPLLELGSMALTEAGERLAAAHCDNSHHHHG